MPEVIIYTKAACPYCEWAKTMLQTKGVSYKEISVTKEPKRLEEMIRLSGGRMTAPEIFIDGVCIGGFDEMKALDNEGRLDPMLGIEAKTGGGEAGETVSEGVGDTKIHDQPCNLRRILHCSCRASSICPR